jgi:hypothetical protein
MTSQVVFLSLFLGLMSGSHMVDLDVGAGVRSVRILLDGQPVAVLHQAPWRATVDFGPSIMPRELVVVGFDKQGDEIARASQMVNVPRPTAEFVITLQNDASGVPVGARLRWEHLTAARPVALSLAVDGKPVTLDRSASAILPRLDMTHPHLIAGEIKFDDGFITRREIVVGGAVGDTAEAELTPIAVRATTMALPANLGDCFTKAGLPLRVAAIEKGPALAIFVVDPDPREPLHGLNQQPGAARFWADLLENRHRIPLDAGTRMRILSPVPEQHMTTSNTTATLFPPSKDVDSESGGLLWFLTRTLDVDADPTLSRQFADAAGVAGLDAITGARRRAVVLVLNHHPDVSSHEPASIRNYLASIGVPLFVWSASGPRPELRDTWGEVEDISSAPKLKAASDRLRAELASQRIAWVAADPVAALRIQSTGRCGITPVASARSSSQ